MCSDRKWTFHSECFFLEFTLKERILLLQSVSILPKYNRKRPNTEHTVILPDRTLKNGASLILPSSITRNSSAPNSKRIFEFLWGILEGRTIRARPSQPFLKNCQNGTFRSVHGIWIFFGPNYFIWGAM